MILSVLREVRDEVADRLGVGVAVDVGDQDAAGVARFPALQPLVVGAEHERAAEHLRAVGDEHARRVAGDHLRRGAHEVDALEVDARRLAVADVEAQAERVAHLVRQLVEFRVEIVVGDDGRVLLRRQAPDLHRLLGELQALLRRVAPGVQVGGIAREADRTTRRRGAVLPYLQSLAVCRTWHQCSDP